MKRTMGNKKLATTTVLVYYATTLMHTRNKMRYNNDGNKINGIAAHINLILYSQEYYCTRFLISCAIIEFPLFFTARINLFAVSIPRPNLPPIGPTLC